jgi:hypothetical protein
MLFLLHVRRRAQPQVKSNLDGARSLVEAGTDGMLRSLPDDFWLYKRDLFISLRMGGKRRRRNKRCEERFHAPRLGAFAAFAGRARISSRSNSAKPSRTVSIQPWPTWTYLQRGLESIRLAPKWVKRRRETGSVAPAAIGGRKPRTLSGDVAVWLEASGDAQQFRHGVRKSPPNVGILHICANCR